MTVFCLFSSFSGSFGLARVSFFKLIYYSPKINSGIAKGESLEKALGTILKDSIPSKFSSYFNPYIRMEAQKGQFEIALDEKAEAIVEIANLLNCYADE